MTTKVSENSVSQRHRVFISSIASLLLLALLSIAVARAAEEESFMLAGEDSFSLEGESVEGEKKTFAV